MNITLLHTDDSITRADLDRYIHDYFPTDNCLKSFEHGYGQDIWKRHIENYDSKITKIVIIRPIEDDDDLTNFFKRSFTDIIMFLPDITLLNVDVIILNSKSDKIEPDSKYAKYLDLSYMDPEEKHRFQGKIDYMKIKKYRKIAMRVF